MRNYHKEHGATISTHISSRIVRTSAIDLYTDPEDRGAEKRQNIKIQKERSSKLKPSTETTDDNINVERYFEWSDKTAHSVAMRLSILDRNILGTQSNAEMSM